MNAKEFKELGYWSYCQRDKTITEAWELVKVDDLVMQDAFVAGWQDAQEDYLQDMR